MIVSKKLNVAKTEELVERLIKKKQKEAGEPGEYGRKEDVQGRQDIRQHA